VKLLANIGWLPMLTKCASCGTKEIDQAFFSSHQGGIICRNCDRQEVRTVPLSKGAIQSLMFCLTSPLRDAVRLKVDHATWRELERTNEMFLQFRLDRNLRSRQFLAEIQDNETIT